MKKTLPIKRLSGLLLVTIFPVLLQAQTPVVNGGFESWSSRTLFEHPTTWFTDVNPLTAPMSTLKETDASEGDYSLKLVTVDHTGISNPVPVGYAVLGKFIYEFPPKGIPWSQIVDEFNVDIKYNIRPGDAGLIWVRMTKDNQVISNIFRMITGIQNSWTTISLDLFSGTPVVPDSLMIGIASSIPEELNIQIYTPVVGSWIMIDDMSFSYNNDLFAVPNFSFEDWEEYAVEETDSWTSSNLLMTYDETTNMIKTTDASSGNYAVQLTTTPTVMSEDPIPGRLSYGSGLLKAGGIPYTDTPRYFSGDYKYSPNGSDQATIEVYFNQDPETWIAGTHIDLTTTNSTYEHFSLPINFPVGQSPDRVFINVFAGSNAGSILKVDNLQLTNVSTGIDNPEYGFKTGLYPNPFKEILYIMNPRDVKRVTLSTLSGQVVSDILTLGAQHSINTSHLLNGPYLITIETTYGKKISEIMVHE